MTDLQEKRGNEDIMAEFKHLDENQRNLYDKLMDVVYNDRSNSLAKKIFVSNCFHNALIRYGLDSIKGK